MKEYVEPKKEEIEGAEGVEEIGPKKVIYEKTILKDWGPQLLIGVERGSPPLIHRDFAFRDFTFEREKEIDKMRSVKGGAGTHHAKTVTTVLAHMLTDWAGESFSNLQQKHREQAINNSYMEDVLYAWVYLRATELERILTINPTCLIQSCGEQYTWKGDLFTMESTISRDRIKPVQFKLSKPIEWATKNYNTLLLMPAKWGAFTGLAANMTTADIKSAVAIASIHALFDPETESSVPMPQRAIDFMSKKDVERLTKAILGDTFPGVDAEFELRCPKCGHVHRTPLDWTWDFFFGSSSL